MRILAILIPLWSIFLCVKKEKAVKEVDGGFCRHGRRPGRHL